MDTYDFLFLNEMGHIVIYCRYGHIYINKYDTTLLSDADLYYCPCFFIILLESHCNELYSIVLKFIYNELIHVCTIHTNCHVYHNIAV